MTKSVSQAIDAYVVDPYTQNVVQYNEKSQGESDLAQERLTQAKIKHHVLVWQRWNEE